MYATIFTNPCIPHTAPSGRLGYMASHICNNFKIKTQNTKHKTRKYYKNRLPKSIKPQQTNQNNNNINKKVK